MGDFEIAHYLCVYVCMYVCVCSNMLMRSNVTHQGQESSEVKLGGKCWFSVFGSPLKS